MNAKKDHVFSTVNYISGMYVKRFVFGFSGCLMTIFLAAIAL